MSHDGHGHEHSHSHEAHGAESHAVPSRAVESRAEPPSVVADTERRASRRLLIVLGLIASFFVVELIGAKLARSDVLEADAFHLLMDVLALAISLGAMRVSSRRPNARFTFGLRRAEPIAALANGVLVLGVAVELIRDAIEHIGHTSNPRSGVMLAVASAALVVNGLNAWLLHGAMGGGHGHAHHGHAHHGHSHGPAAHDHDDDDDDKAHAHEDHGPTGHQLNLRGAWLHLLGDAMGSFAAFCAGLAIRYGAPPVVDPLASFVVVAVLIIGALRLLRDAGLVLFEAAPPHLSVVKIEKVLLKVDGIKAVSALHVWSLGTGHDAITAHVQASKVDPTLGSKATASLRKKFNVEYVTVQVDMDVSDLK